MLWPLSAALAECTVGLPKPYWTLPLQDERCTDAYEGCEFRRQGIAQTCPDIVLASMRPVYGGPDFLGYTCSYSSASGCLQSHQHGHASYLWCPGGYQRAEEGCVKIPVYVESPEAACKTGNPIVIGSGAKIEHVVDFRTTGAPTLEFARTYNAQRVGRSSLGVKWAGSFDRFLTFNGISKVYVNRPDGEVLRFDRASDGN